MTPSIDVQRVWRRGSIESFVIKALGAGLAFLAQITLARTYGASGYGVLSVALTIANFGAIVSALGLPNATMRFVAEYRARAQWSHLRGLLAFGPTTIGAASLVLSGLLATVGMLFAHGSEQQSMVGVAAVLLPFACMIGWMGKAIRGFGLIRQSMIAEDILFWAVLIALAFFVSPANLYWGAGVFVIAYVAAIGLAIYFLVLARPRSLRDTPPTYSRRLWLSSGLTTLFGTLMLAILQKGDIVALGIFADMASTGAYAAATRTSALISFPRAVIDNVAAPIIGTLYHERRFVETRRFFLKATLWSSVSGVVLGIFVAVAAKWLMGLFGADFSASAPILWILLIGHISNAITGPAGFTLIMTGKERLFAQANTIGAAMNLIGCLTIIPKYGVLGAAAVTAASTALTNVLLFVWVMRRVLRPA